MFEALRSTEQTGHNWGEFELMPFESYGNEESVRDKANLASFSQASMDTAVTAKSVGQVEFKLMVRRLEETVRLQVPGSDTKVFDLPTVAPTCGSLILEKILNHFLGVVTQFGPTNVIVHGEETARSLEISINAFSPIAIPHGKKLSVSSKTKTQAASRGIVLRDGKASSKQVVYRLSVALEH